MSDLSGIDYTTDDFLGGIIKLHQPRQGYRVANDTVFLAASLTPKKGERILDMGAGTGGILTCLAGRLGERVNTLTLHGIELQPHHVAFARANAELNGFADQITYFEGDIATPPELCVPGSYHHVVTNPPYLENGMATPSPYDSKALAHMDSHIPLEDWIGLCLRMLRPRGYLSLVQRADRLDDILAVLHGRCGSITVFPIWTVPGRDARRVLVRARKDGRGATALKAGIVVHKSDGTYTAAAEAVLRHGEGLDITG
ncbi:tRNA1(Val) (adenine(37)-N6)-methyltransferase [Luteithermobacter gelatinilyticus]|uniref:tRNA1(Val) (adenine(37)-N6)-methyltransferase n=1 Tax=Luteithermobacter gelatinilyticus TaxID=2582913 RepID=UPI001106A41C|nr:methyltransferase domain-containing protein [Luteithermobacter gelatinilyticus]